MIEAIILAGGLGTRLATAVPGLPKVLAPIRGTPFLDLMLPHLAQTGLISKVVLAIGFKADAVLRHFERRKSPLPLAFSMESAPLGTGGALLNALPHTKGETLLVLNGDCFCNLSLDRLYSAHMEKKADLTLGAVYSEDLSRYGSVRFADDRRIVEFKEKSAENKEGYLNAGIYLFQREVLQRFRNQPCSIETDLFPHLLAEKMFAFPHEGTFLDIGTPPSYELAQEMLKTWISTSPAACMDS